MNQTHQNGNADGELERMHQLFGEQMDALIEEINGEEVA